MAWREGRPDSIGLRSNARFWAVIGSVGAPIALGVVTTIASVAGAQELGWATSAGGEGSDGGGDVATDPSGNSFVTGFFEGAATFGAGEANETVLFDAGSQDVFVAKYAKDGTLQWATSAGGSAFDLGHRHRDGPPRQQLRDRLLLGHGDVRSGRSQRDRAQQCWAGDLFVAKYARTAPCSGPRARAALARDLGLGIATDARGNSYVTGDFFGTATFGAGEANETMLSSAGATDLFVAKYAQDGTLLWARSAGGVSSDVGAGIATNARGNSYVTGNFFGTATFGAGEANETVLGSAGFFDLFVAKYARDGTLLWATSAGGASLRFGLRHRDRRPRRQLCYRHFFDTATFGAGEANETVLSSAGSGDLFVAKYARDGTLLWATSAGGVSLDSRSGIATNARGESYVTGSFIGTATFGAGEANETVLNSPDNFDVFVAKYARDGTLLWATNAGDPDETDQGARNRDGSSRQQLRDRRFPRERDVWSR